MSTDSTLPKDPKLAWQETPLADLKPLTFGELEDGDVFIFIVDPQGRPGEGTLRDTHNVFRKFLGGGVKYHDDWRHLDTESAYNMTQKAAGTFLRTRPVIKIDM